MSDTEKLRTTQATYAPTIPSAMPAAISHIAAQAKTKMLEE